MDDITTNLEVLKNENEELRNMLNQTVQNLETAREIITGLEMQLDALRELMNWKEEDGETYSD